MSQQQRGLTALLVALSLTLLSGCTPGNIRDTLDNQKPRVSVAGQQITRLDFQQVGMAFDIQIDNPNPVALSLAGLDYDLKLAGHSFASGKQNKQMQLKAAGPSSFQLPLSMRFAEIYQGLKQLKGKNEVPYELTTGLMIDVPLLGKLRYPVSTSGTLPLPRLPRVSVKSLTLEKLNYSGATLALKLKVNNPNGFGVALDKLRYDFKVNGKRWISGNRASLGNLAAKQGNELTLPITLNFMELGSGLYSLLKGGQDLNYNLSGQLDATGGHPLIGNFDVPINRSGKVRLAN